MSLTPESERHLRAAEGFLELGLPLDAIAELEDIAASERHLAPVLAVRLEACRDLSKWELMQTIAKRLTQCEPQQPRWWTAWARSTARRGLPDEALEIVRRGIQQHPNSAELFYEQAYCASEVGDVLLARESLSRAFKLNPDLRLRALDDKDLQSIWLPS